MFSKILRLPQVMDGCGFARSTVYLRVKQGLLTKPISIGPRSIGWPENEIHAINAARIAGHPEAEIQALVATLQANRKSGVQ
jgi:prophage regulatory protein